MGWCIAKDAGLLLKCNDLINAVTACPMCFKQCLRQLTKESEAIHQSSQSVRNIDYIGTLPLSEGSTYALVCVDTASGLTQAFPCRCTNQVATIRGLEKVSTIYRYHHQINCDWESHFKGHNM